MHVTQTSSHNNLGMRVSQTHTQYNCIQLHVHQQDVSEIAKSILPQTGNKRNLDVMSSTYRGL